MPDSLYLQTFDQCGLNLFLLARFIPDGVLLIFPYLFIPSRAGRSSCHVLPDFSHPYTKRFIRRCLVGPLVHSHRDQIPHPARDQLG
ncbi:MAG: hypothetical protein VXZ91_10695 [Pseudomonadota bacterium]|nr:hypothetical protein [Pseudomonadota bacterium]